MYILFSILIAICVFFFVLNFWRRKKIIYRICRMKPCEKNCLLNELIHPFGFSYDDFQDIFTSTVDAWQREFGYHALFDRMASRFNMVFDCEPIYFDYDGRTWLIELWKGQYGINTGAEIGIYYADRTLSPEQYDQTLFQSVPDERMLPMSLTLKQCGKTLFYHQKTHWWLTGFYMGKFCRPEELEMNVTITFPDDAMLSGFMESLLAKGFHICDICIGGLTLSFSFTAPHRRQHGILLWFHSKLSQLENQIFVRLFNWITKPFSRTADRLLYLYYFLPFAFRHTVKIRNCCGKCARRVRHS